MTSAVCSTRTLLITLLTLLALLFINVFLRDLARVSLEAVPDVERDDEEPISLWPGYAHEAPRGKTCQQWLTQADEQPGSERDWQQQPVVIAAGEERTVRGCAVPCVLVRDPSSHDGCDAGYINIHHPSTSSSSSSSSSDQSALHDSVPLLEHTRDGTSGTGSDSEASSSSSSSCSLLVVRQGSPWEEVKMPNASNVVAMTSSLSSDVPIGLPTYTDFSFLDQPTAKTAGTTVLAILNAPCHSQQLKFDVIRALGARGLPVQPYGTCIGNKTAAVDGRLLLCRHRFVLLFEELAPLDWLSREYWAALACGTVPIVVSRSPIGAFAPADNAVLQINSPDDLPAVVNWVRFALSWPPAYQSFLQWKRDAPASAFLALLDLTLTPATCRLCIHVADRVSSLDEQQPWSVSERGTVRHGRVCRCRDESANVTMYHLFVRERGTFAFHPFFLSSSDLSATALLSAVYTVFSSLPSHLPLPHRLRPHDLALHARRRIFRVYPVEAAHSSVMGGQAALRRNEQVEQFVTATPCPKLEVIFL